MKNQITASAFWQLYQHSSREGAVPKIEQLRHRCLLGFTALEAALYTYWESSVISEWDETMTLVAMILNSASSDETLERLASRTDTRLKKSQLVATLGFLLNVPDASRFAPNYVDFAVYLLLRGNPAAVPLVQQLLDAQVCRNSMLPTAGDWSEIQAHRSLKIIEETAHSLCSLGENFIEVFGSEIYEGALKKSMHAA